MATIGQQLKAAREAKGISENDAGIATKTLTRIIVAMEADDFSGMAAPTYAKGFIRLYANYLGLDPEPLVEEYIARHTTAPKLRLDEKKPQQKTISPADLSPTGMESALPLKNAPGAVTQFFSKVWPRNREDMIEGNDPTAPARPAKDLRALAAGAAGLIVLIVLIVSITNCARRRAAAEPAEQPAAESPARPLIEGTLPDLYLVEPGKIESSR